jgi:hypothetical protein
MAFGQLKELAIGNELIVADSYRQFIINELDTYLHGLKEFGTIIF